MPDIIIHRLPFGGVAFEGVTDKGEEWLDQFVSDHEGDGGIIYDERHACMAGFGENVYGFEPHDADLVFSDALMAGLKLEPAK